MFTSDNKLKAENIRTLKHVKYYTAAVIFTALFGAIYELFSHEVYSFFMIYAFALPLVFGLLPLLLIGLSDKCQPGRTSLLLYNSGIAALTVGSLFKGVLDIFGTTSRLIWVYPIAGGGLFAAGIIIYAVQKPDRRQDIAISDN